MPGRGLPPSRRSSACASTVLPAPVSPVSTLSPGPRRSSARSISRRFSTRSSSSTPWVYQRRPTEPRLRGDFFLTREDRRLQPEPLEALHEVDELLEAERLADVGVDVGLVGA